MDAAADIRLAKTSPMALACYCNPKLYMPKHLAFLNLELRKAIATPNSVTLIHAPPRHGKSMLCSWALPVWYLGNNPDHRVMMFAHSDGFAAKWGRKTRDTMDYHGAKIWGHRVRKDSSAAGSWNLVGHQGGIESMGVGKGSAGLGANLLILDDPIGKAAQAMSASVLENQWDWWNGVAENRLEPGASIVFIMHRWRSNDLAGRMIDGMRESGQPFREIRLAAIADEEPDIIGRQLGEALWPERFPIERLRHREATQGFWFNALYQGRPVPKGGCLFRSDWFEERRFNVIDDPSGRQGYVLKDTGEVCLRGDCYHFVFCDPSLGKKYSDRCGIGVFAVTPSNRLLLLHWVSRRIPIEDIPQRMAETANAWAAEFIGIEANGYQIQVATSTRLLTSRPVRELDPEGKSKLVRAMPAIELAKQGSILLPEKAPWVGGFLEPLCIWTGEDGDRDEEADVLAYAAQEIRGREERACDEEPFALGGGYQNLAGSGGFQSRC